ncbi:MAG TPA: PIG-L deacetylase family protein [Candidatus Micrarchaeia archaeon]|nr:PIG-L deacetylase family protein [Candidatus Micrarchaeia archaeon]
MRRLSRALLTAGAALAAWLVMALVTTDFGVPERWPRRARRVLAVFPHADDETVTCGGTLHRLARGGARVVLVLLTEGERGTPGGDPAAGLRAVRAAEARAAGRRLGAAAVLQADFGDGELEHRRRAASAFLDATIRRERPHLIVTYDRAGLYGHPDHVACSAVVTELRDRRHPATTLWHTALPGRVLGVMRWAGQLSTTPEVERRRAPPTHRVFVGRDLFAKRAAWARYRSQRQAMARGVARLLPLWLVVFLQPYEHFTEVAAPGRPDPPRVAPPRAAG